MKYNLLPETYQDRFDELELDWTEMTASKFLSEAQKYEDAAEKKKLKHQEDGERKTNNKRKPNESGANLS